MTLVDWLSSDELSCVLGALCFIARGHLLPVCRHGEGLGFVTGGRSPSQDISHTLDLCGAALATSLIAQGVGDVATANSMMKLTVNFANVYDKDTGLLLNGKDDAYYEGTFWNYSFRQLPE